MASSVKEEPLDLPRATAPIATATTPAVSVPFIYLSSSDSDSDGSVDEEAREYLNQVLLREEEEKSKRIRASEDESKAKRQRVGEAGDGLHVGYRSPVSAETSVERTEEERIRSGIGAGVVSRVGDGGRQFWKAGDFECVPASDWVTRTVGMEHVRVHPRFLHSNATSHKWVLGAFAELLDNALDEKNNGATYVNIDMSTNKKYGSRVLLIEDDGGGMDPEKMRQCMSLGYSAKSKIANTIGQYGNGFKTSTMRLGADVIVFSRCRGKDGKRPTQSIGLLSYTFLRTTGKEDIVVPMLDYERERGEWKKLIRSTQSDWDRNVETIVHWSPFADEEDLLRQFNMMKDHGTRIIIYNLWEDDQGLLELDFDTDEHDIQIRGVNRDEKNIQMAAQYPNSRHFLTYRHSLRSYASILYLRLPVNFRIILRGRDVEHHNIINDMMHIQEHTYRPQVVPDAGPRDLNMCAVVSIGFVKDAKDHIDVQGFNVYHKNRLIKPFWRLWNAAGSDGRGVIGLLEANFVEPAHDKQGFERTTVLSRLENRLVTMQKQYWNNNCQEIGYKQRRGKIITKELEDSPDFSSGKSPQPKTRGTSSAGFSSGSRSEKLSSRTNRVDFMREFDESIRTSNANHGNGHRPNGRVHTNRNSGMTTPTDNGKEPSSSSDDMEDVIEIQANGSNQMPASSSLTSVSSIIDQLRKENRLLTERLQKEEEKIVSELREELESERQKNMLLQAQVVELEKKVEEMNKEQESLIDIFSEERDRRDAEEQSLRKKTEEATNTILELTEKIARLERK